MILMMTTLMRMIMTENMGNSGVTSTGVHCHLTAKRNGEIVNPEEYFDFE